MNNNIGEFIKEIRLEKNLKQRELGKLVGVDDKTVSKWERGVYLPDITLLSPLSKALGVTVDELLECKRHEPPQIEIKEEPKPKNKFTTKTKLLFIIIITIVSISTISASIFTNYIRKNKSPDDQIATNDANVYKITSDDENLIIEGYILKKEDGQILIIKKLCFKNIDITEIDKTTEVLIYFQNREVVLRKGIDKNSIIIEGNSIGINNIETKLVHSFINKDFNNIILELNDKKNNKINEYEYRIKIVRNF